LDGSLVGAKDKMIFKANTNIAYSDTSLHVVLNNFAPTSIKADMKNLRLEKALKMLNQAPYSDGLLSLHVDVSDARTTKLKGNIKVNVEHGLLNSAYLSKTYEFKTKMPKTTFELNTDTTLDGNNAYTKLNLDSSLAKLDMKKLKFNIKTGSLNSDYIAKIPNLDKLFFVTDRHMRGGITLNGEISKDNNLDLTMHSKVAKGKIDAKLHNDDFHADLIGVDTIGLLHMLKYPELFQAKLDARLDYNLAMSKGVLDGDLLKGHFVKNKTFDMIKQYAKFNMYKEKFSGDVNAKINKENILTSLNLKSNSSAIVTKDTKLNTKTQQIDSKLKVVANKNPIDLELSGDINQPNVKIDLEKFMKSKAGEKVQKELNRFFKKLF